MTVHSRSAKHDGVIGSRKSGGGEKILRKHGAGGRAMRSLIEKVLIPGLAETAATGQHRWHGLDCLDDGAAVKLGDRWLIVSTDSHVIQPIFFPGGDIGRLAIAGTVNDLAMMGATEVLGLTVGLIVEEGFPLADLERVQRSLVETSREAGAPIVTGDTKVMGRGELDGLILNTTGIALCDRPVSDSGLRVGDRLIVTGSLADHGFAILATRHDLDVEGELYSDTAPLNDLVRAALLAGGDDIVAMKDPTRGGVASALYEMATKSRVAIELDEQALPIRDEVRALGELLGIDPLHVANEGKALLGVREKSVDRVLEALRGHPLGRQAAVIGRCASEPAGSVLLDTGFGRRYIAEIEGDPLPRIC